jgi:gamma-butyrobetaine dioxygenase
MSDPLAGLAPDWRTEDAKRLWTAADFPVGPPAWSWPDYLARPQARADCLSAVLADGFAVLRGVPPEPGAVLEVAGRMGFVRETNYGRLFDVRVTATPSNLAYTGLPIAPHTDNPYRDPVPTVQLLHCLHSDVAGGDSGVTDGFAAAGLLRAADPAAFELLAATPVTFAYADATAAAGAAFYAAYRAFAEILRRPELQLTFRLAPGECLVLDNTRVLHARTGFAATGGRHLQGCYADLDGVSSTLALLRRNPQ